MNIHLDRVGIWSPSAAWDQSPELADAAAELEELGYGTLWLGSSRGDLELPAALIQSTRRLVVTTAIINVWTNPASELAARYAQLEAETPGSAQVTHHWSNPRGSGTDSRFAGWPATWTSSIRASRRFPQAGVCWVSSVPGHSSSRPGAVRAPTRTLSLPNTPARPERR